MGFGTLIDAQALGDRKALLEARRRITVFIWQSRWPGTQHAWPGPSRKPRPAKISPDPGSEKNL